jgi:hypothetical protein
MSPHVSALPAPTTKGIVRCSVLFAVPPHLFCEYAVNGEQDFIWRVLPCSGFLGLNELASTKNPAALQPDS